MSVFYNLIFTDAFLILSLVAPVFANLRPCFAILQLFLLRNKTINLIIWFIRLILVIYLTGNKAKLCTYSSMWHALCIRGGIANCLSHHGFLSGIVLVSEIFRNNFWRKTFIALLYIARYYRWGFASITANTRVTCL